MLIARAARNLPTSSRPSEPHGKESKEGCRPGAHEEPEDEEVEDGEEEEYDDAVDDIYSAIDGFINLIVSRLADKLKELNKDMEQNK